MGKKNVVVAKEIQEFHTNDNKFVPHSEWVNTLYVYPQNINMSGWSGKGSARNISIQVSVRDDDTDPMNTPNLPVRYSLSTFQV